MPKKQKKKARKGSALRGTVNPNAAGIDIGATENFVAVPSDRCDEPVRSFPTFTEDLRAMAKWLQECGVTTVAMESTGVYWVPVFQVLEESGLQVHLVNAQHVKNVPGRKTDVSDCQWLQYLHSVGLLTGSFRPRDQVCALRSLVRHRANLVAEAARHVQHIHKALSEMNLKIQHVISEIVGVSGQRILDAILAGKRDPDELAKLRDHRVKADPDKVRKSLVGDYRPEHLLVLRQSLAAFRFCRQQTSDLDAEIEKYLAEFEPEVPPEELATLAPRKASRTNRSHKGCPDFRVEFYRVLGTDLTLVPGFDVGFIQNMTAEIGTDVSAFATPERFVSWLRLCPNRKVSGGRVLRSKPTIGNSRAALAFRMAAQSAGRSQTYLGHYYRRMRARLGASYANKATAHKLARIYYHLVKTRDTYDEAVLARSEEHHVKRFERKVRSQAAALGYALVPTDDAV